MAADRAARLCHGRGNVIQRTAAVPTLYREVSARIRIMSSDGYNRDI